MDKVQHFEIPADDVARTRKFYEDSFGWRTAEWPMPDGGVYIGLHTGPADEKTGQPKEPGYINGGMYKRGGNFAKTAVITLVVEDIQKSIEKIKIYGGKIIAEPKIIPNVGVYAYFQDTENNIIGLWQELKK